MQDAWRQLEALVADTEWTPVTIKDLKAKIKALEEEGNNSEDMQERLEKLKAKLKVQEHSMECLPSWRQNLLRLPAQVDLLRSLSEGGFLAKFQEDRQEMEAWMVATM